MHQSFETFRDIIQSIFINDRVWYSRDGVSASQRLVEQLNFIASQTSFSASHASILVKH